MSDTTHDDRLPIHSPTPPDLYQLMRYIRSFEERVLELRRDDHVSGSVHLCVGQEVVPAVVVSQLDDRDRVIGTYRGHGWALACGAPPVEVMAEILGRAGGTNGGRAGSAYLSAPDRGFLGENSIVGAGAPIANGVAMGLEAAGLGGVSVVSFGDGATNQGALHEALVFAIARNLPVLFVCENNEWSEMTPISATVPHVAIHERARGYGIESVVANGEDIYGLAAVVEHALAKARRGDGPTFLEVRVPRLLGHYNGDIEQYRSDEDRAEHARRDPLVALADALLSSRERDDDWFASVGAWVEAEIDSETRAAMQSPVPQSETALEHVVARPLPMPAPTRADVVAIDLSYGMAVNRVLNIEMDARPNMIVFGEDVAIPGGPFGVTRNLRKKFGDRVFDTPISEAAILGAALGSSLEGLLPVVEIMWTDFMLVALDQIANQMANVRYLSQGRRHAPLVIRMQQGVTPGSCAQHCQSLEAILAHIPGIRVGLPSTPQDAFAMLRAAIADPDPVVIIESRALYLDKGKVDVEAPVEAIGGARLRSSGTDIAIVSWGRMAQTSLVAVELLAAEGISANLLDLRWLNPLDSSSIETAIQSSGKLLIAHEANVTGGFGGEVAARVAQEYFHQLDAPIVRVGMPDVRVPAAPNLQDAVLPGAARIAEAARRLATY